MASGVAVAEDLVDIPVPPVPDQHFVAITIAFISVLRAEWNAVARPWREKRQSRLGLR